MTTQPSSKSLAKRPRKSRTRKRNRRHLVVQTLQSRELMAADFSWEGDVLKVSGSESDDFLAVQTSQLGTQVVDNGTFISEFEGRTVDSAASIEIFGGGGNDLLFSYQSPIPVSLFGEGGNDFAFSDDLDDILDGGDGRDWVYSQDIEGTMEDAFGIPGFDLDPSSLNGNPEIDENHLIKLKVEVGGQANIAGKAVDLEGLVDVDRSGINVALSGMVPTWDDAFGVSGFDLANTGLTVGAGHDSQAGDSYSVAFESSMDADGTAINIDGEIVVNEDSVAAEFHGTIADWGAAFGIDGLVLPIADCIGSGSVDVEEHTDLDLQPFQAGQDPGADRYRCCRPRS